MNERVRDLRRQTLETKPWLSTERAELMTEFYRTAPAASVPCPRALAFQYLLEHKTICIGDGGADRRRARARPKATPTYPELCCHSLEDLDILDTREKIPFAVSTRRARRLRASEIIPFWRGRSMRDRIFAEMTDEWKAAYEAGVFTEFMEQRAPGHTVLDDKIYRQGLAATSRRTSTRALGALDYLERPRGVRQAAGAAGDARSPPTPSSASPSATPRRPRDAGGRRSRPARERRSSSGSPRSAARVPAHAPRDFWEALQAYWFVHLGVITELNTWDSFSPGRLDQHLYPFYQREPRRRAR